MSYKVLGQGKRWTVILGDVLDYLEGSLWLRQYEESYFHLLLSDWPYNLESITKRYGKAGSKPAGFREDGAYARQSAGFMNATWDTDLAYRPETWERILPHLYPGAFTTSFSHPRKQHRLGTAQEQAGFIIAPAFYDLNVPAGLGWIYGSGKANGTRIDTQLRRRGEEDLAGIWAGHQYGSPLRPEIEPIIVGMKPYEGKPVESIVRYGAGAVNLAFGKAHKASARFPGNLIVSHLPGCLLRGQKRLKNSSGNITGEEPSSRTYGKTLHTYGVQNQAAFKAHKDEDGYEWVPDYDCEPGCPVRRMNEQAGKEKGHYFYQADWGYERIEGVTPVFYSGKVQSEERNAGCEELPLELRRRINPGGLEREKRWAATHQYNAHPCLKPLKLTSWLAGLFLPPAEYPARCFVPCCGTGSEAVGAMLAGFKKIVAVEKEKEYALRAVARLSFWETWLESGQTDPEIALRATRKRQDTATPEYYTRPLF